jgi:AraC family transcriptional regulator
MDYRKALEMAVIYIENHLGDSIKVEAVAKAAGYSYYHLNRQFMAVLGEGLGSYIKKRRLAEAAKRLLYSAQKVIDIAMDSGFESPEAFSRAFKAVYSVSPQMYRKNRLDILLGSKERLDTGLLDHLACNVTVHPKIVELPEIKVAGLRGETTLRDNRLLELWQRANSTFTQVPNRIPNGRGFGICEACLTGTLYTMNEDIMFSEVAGTEVYSFEGLPEPFVRKIIPGGRYAVFTHQGTLRMLPQTFDYIWGTWFLTTKEEMDGREDFEMYDSRFLGYDHPKSETDLYIPIQ